MQIYEIEKIIKQHKRDIRKEYILDIKFEIIYFLDSIKYSIKSVYNGIKNFWKWKKIIWNDRWYDYSFLDEIIRFKLTNMKNHWRKDTHYVGDWDERLLLERLVEILDEIDYIENEMPENMSWTEQTEKVQELYEEFGNLLYSVREFEKEDSGKNHKYKTNGIQTLWD